MSILDGKFAGGSNINKGHRRRLSETTLEEDVAAGDAAQAADEVLKAGALAEEIAFDTLSFESDAGAGGAATEAMTVTGLLATDVIQSVSQKTEGANSLALLGWSTQIVDGVTGIWAADPGAGAVLEVIVKRPV